MTEQEMMKETLEWQEHIRKLITATDDELYHKRSKVFDWLIKQAEKREYWMEQHRKRCNELEDAYFKIQLIEKQLHQAQAKAERYKQALENITISPIPLEIDDAVNIARQALKGETK